MNASKLGFVALAGLMIMLALPLVMSAVQTLGVFRQNECVNLPQTCIDCDYNNITAIYYPNMSNSIEETEMTKVGTSYNLTFCDTNIIGQYIVEGFNDYDVWVYDFWINPSGVQPTTAQGGLSIGILISAVCLMFFFGWLGFKFMETDKSFPIGLFFFLVAIIISLYSLYLGVVYSRDYLYSSTADVQSKFFIGIMLGLVGVMFLGLLMLIIMAVKEIKERKSIQKYGNNWDNKTKTYKY